LRPCCVFDTPQSECCVGVLLTWLDTAAAAIASLLLQVERLLHFSDLGAAADHPSARMRSKAAGDAAVRETFPDATIFK
jgi:uncharacterized protein YbjT (DUF2867 family)